MSKHSALTLKKLRLIYLFGLIWFLVNFYSLCIYFYFSCYFSVFSHLFSTLIFLPDKQTFLMDENVWIQPIIYISKNVFFSKFIKINKFLLEHIFHNNCFWNTYINVYKHFDLENSCQENKDRAHGMWRESKRTHILFNIKVVEIHANMMNKIIYYF